jgi:hypothetical protein
MRDSTPKDLDRRQYQLGICLAPRRAARPVRALIQIMTLDADLFHE